MSKARQQDVGSFVRWELMTRSVAQALDFYKSLFSWSYDAAELNDGATYYHLLHGNHRIGGIYAMADDLAGKPAAAHWTPYLGVSDVDQSLLEAKSMGAKVTAESFDFAALGRMALLLDPTGAPFGLWQDQQRTLLERSVAWHELSTHDAESAATFYGDLFNWITRPDSQGEVAITRFYSGPRPTAALITLSPRFRAVPPHWLPYFYVEDMALATKALTQSGGRILAEPSHGPSGTQAVVQDPQGAVFGVMTV
ncbi:MAG: VOC family protein [Deltaproteobacteria bacterium]|nr:VOC family protein [Deltaproteobacteria bacterium]